MDQSDDEESQLQSPFAAMGLDQQKFGKLFPLCCCVLCILAIVYPFASLRSVPAASVGVVTTFGSVSDETLDSGTHIVNPFAGVTIFSTMTRLFEEPSTVPTKEGLNVQLDVGMLYHIDPRMAHSIYLKLGEKYETTYITPQLASAVRGVTGSVAAEALYNNTREKLQVELTRQMNNTLQPHGIIVETILLKDIQLPELLKKAIETKTAAQQEAERMKFVIQKETQEAERKKIEAGGIKDFQNIVSQGISDPLLKWKGIEATEKLVDAKNSKLVIMGNSQASLPVLMSN